MSNRILIVDDNPEDVAMLEAFLDDEASSIRAETQSRRAEEAIAEFDPDLVLLDLRMPAPDGMEVLRRIRSVRQTAGFLPVIVITGEVVTRRSETVAPSSWARTTFSPANPSTGRRWCFEPGTSCELRQLYVELANTNTALKKRLSAV